MTSCCGECATGRNTVLWVMQDLSMRGGRAILSSAWLSVGVPPAESVGAYGLPAFFCASSALESASGAAEEKNPLQYAYTLSWVVGKGLGLWEQSTLK